MITRHYRLNRGAPTGRTLRRFRLVWALLLLLGTFPFLQSLRPAHAHSQAGPGSPLRLLTYNTAFVSAPIAGDVNAEKFGMPYEERAKRIAERILLDDNDVVALNEVFSEDVAKQLVQLLEPKYKSWIAVIDGEAVTEILGESGNSGLMIFSKHPFVPFPATAHPLYDHVNWIRGMNNGVPWDGPDRIAVRVYQACTDSGFFDDDCKASKAIAMVRMQHATTGAIFNVAFTHLQASYYKNGADDAAAADVRKKQMADTKELITRSLTPAELQSQTVFLMGDLNIAGENDHTPNNQSSEWTFHFDTPGEFFSCGEGLCTYDPSTGQGSFMTES